MAASTGAVGMSWSIASSVYCKAPTMRCFVNSRKSAPLARGRRLSREPTDMALTSSRHRRKTRQPELGTGEDARQLRRWRAWHRERVEALLSGPYETKTRALISFLGTMTLRDGAKLVEHVRANGWREADHNARFEALSLINRVITRLRERNTFDDPLPKARSTAFIIVRELFGP
jgi:hypothetical protein